MEEPNLEDCYEGEESNKDLGNSLDLYDEESCYSSSHKLSMSQFSLDSLSVEIDESDSVKVEIDLDESKRIWDSTYLLYSISSDTGMIYLK